MRPRGMLLLGLLSCLLVGFGAAADGVAAGDAVAADAADSGDPGAAAAHPVVLPTAAGPVIDYHWCGKRDGVICGVRASCLRDANNNEVDVKDDKVNFPEGRSTLVFMAVGDPREWTVENDCTVGLWIWPLSADTWIVKMQVRSSDQCRENNCKDEAKRQKIDPIQGMALSHAGRTLFGCKPENGTIRALGGNDVELYEFEESRLKPEDCYCAFLIKNADKARLTSKIKVQCLVQIAKLPAGETFMEFVLTTGIYDTLASNGFEKVPETRHCNIFNAKSTPEKTFDSFIKVQFKDLLSRTLHCKGHSKLYAAMPGQTAKPAKSVMCIKDDPTAPPGTVKWIYEIKYRNGRDRVPKDTDFPAFCAVPVATWCKEPDYQGEQPPEFKREDGSGKVSITCPKNKWLINNAHYYIGLPECKNSLTQSNNASWIVKIGGKDVEITMSECTKDLKCQHSTSYKNDCPSEYADACAKLLTTDGLRCPVEYTLTAVQLDGEKFPMEKIECNLKKGVWTNYANLTMELDRDANVYCEPDKVEAAAQMDAKTLRGISYGAIGVVIIVLLIFAVKEIVSRLRT